MLRGHGGPTEPEHGVGTLGDLGTRRATLESPWWSLTSSQSPRHLDSPPWQHSPPGGALRAQGELGEPELEALAGGDRHHPGAVHGLRGAGGGGTWPAAEGKPGLVRAPLVPVTSPPQPRSTEEV